MVSVCASWAGSAVDGLAGSVGSGGAASAGRLKVSRNDIPPTAGKYF